MIKSSIITFLFASLLSSCITFSTSEIFSPNSNDGLTNQSHRTHGGPTKNSPPDQIIFELNDSIHTIIRAKVFSEKWNLSGVLLPIFPTFLLPRKNFYNESNSNLVLYLTIIGNINSVKVLHSEVKSNIGESHIVRQEQDLNTKLTIELNALENDSFQLNNTLIKADDIEYGIPSIKFVRMKQKWRFFGP